MPHRARVDDRDSGRFDRRQQAAAELERLGDAATSALGRELETTSSAEVRRAVRALLDRLEAPGPEQLRATRVVEVLEWTATPEAVRLPDNLAAGAADARLTREAAAAQDRLGRAGPAREPGPAATSCPASRPAAASPGWRPWWS
jgi:hypothetical protein